MKKVIYIINLIISITIGCVVLYFSSKILLKYAGEKLYFILLLVIAILIFVIPLIKKILRR